MLTHSMKDCTALDTNGVICTNTEDTKGSIIQACTKYSGWPIDVSEHNT